MSRQFFAAVAILAFVLIALTVVIVTEPVPLRSMPLPRVYPPMKYQFATELHYEGVPANMSAVIETDGTTIGLAYPLATDPKDRETYLYEMEWIWAGGNLIYMKYMESDQRTHIVMLDGSAIPPYGSEGYPVDGVEYLLEENIPPVKITPDDGLNHFEPAFSDALGKIAYLASAPDQNSDIYTINVDGTEVTQITNTPDMYENQISWSPDGTMLTFTADVEDTPQIFVVPATGGEPTQLTYGLPKFSPVWSWSGERLFYVAYRSGGGIAWIQSMSLSGKDIYTHYTAIPDTLGATAYIDGLALGADQRTLAFIKGEQLVREPDSYPQYTHTLHFLDLQSGQLTSPVWDEEEQPMMFGLAWRRTVPGLEVPFF